MDGSWRLDRKNGGNRSLNETDIRKAMIDSRFHHDDDSAKGCCYNSSNFIKENSDEDQTSEPNLEINQSAPDKTKEKINSNSSLDASWCLDRSDGTNRSLNQTEIEDKKPSAPNQVYPSLPFNPFFGNNPPPIPVSHFFGTSPPPMPINTPPAWSNGPTLGELMEIERQDLEDGATYNHEL